MCESSEMYRKWHENSGHAVAHWLIMIFFAASVSLTLSNFIDTKYASAMTSKAYTSTNQSSVAGMTTDLLRAAKAYLKTSGSAQDAALYEVTQIALKRQKALISKAKTDPAGVLTDALPESLMAQLPEAIIALIEREKTVEGTLTVNQVDYLNGALADEILFTLTESGTGKKYNLYFDAEPKNLRTGAKVTARGINIENELVLGLNSSNSNLQVTSSALTGTSGDEKTLAILINFKDNTSQPFTAADAISKIFLNPDSTDAYYNENSYGATNFTGTAVGWYTISVSSATCDYNAFASAGLSAAQAAGVSTSGYEHFVFIFPNIGACSWAGLSNVGGNPSNSWINGYNDSYVISHELGHALGMRHASSYNCGLQQIGPSCSMSEYGDPYDDMGASWIHRHLAGSHKYQLGWGNTQTVTSSGTYTIFPQEVSQTGAQILRILKPDTGEAYYVDYRQPIGFDTSMPGDMFNTSITVWGGAQTKRLDMSPDGNFNSSSLSDGTSFVDSANNITITQLSHTATSATIQVAMSGPSCSRSTPSITISPVSQSVASGQTATYSVTVKNNDSSVCPTGSFVLYSGLASGLSGSFTSPTLSIAPGSSASSQLYVSSTAGFADGSYGFSANVTTSDNAYQNSTNGTYIIFTPVADTIPPTVSISSPISGTTLSAANVTITASASDNVKVTKVDILIDGVRVATDTATPYTYKWNIRKTPVGAHTISAKAYDAAGNTSTASIPVTTR